MLTALERPNSARIHLKAPSRHESQRVTKAEKSEVRHSYTGMIDYVQYSFLGGTFWMNLALEKTVIFGHLWPPYQVKAEFLKK